MSAIRLQTDKKRQVIDITDEVEKSLPEGEGVVNVFLKHTTAAVTAADLDPGGTDEDYLTGLQALTPKESWNHPHDPAHFPDHMWAAFIGPDMNVPYRNGKLMLGSWQRVILVELDGPRQRDVEITAYQVA